jgi:metacaspase-1
MKKALLIGIDYIGFNEDVKLYGCINDANIVANMLMDAYDYPKKNITMMRDDTENPTLSPNRKNLITQFNKIMSQSNNLEEIWIHFSGHGTLRNDRDGDEKDFKDEVIIPIDYRTNGVISDDVLFDILNKSKCRTIITFDCCNSGSLFDLPWRFEYDNNKFIKYRENNKFLTNKNIVMFSSCRDNQLAVDTWDKERKMSTGGMTPGLIDTLRHNRYNAGIFKLFRDITNYQNILNREQITTLSSSSEFPDIKFLRPIIMHKNDIIYNATNKTENSFLN